jgi:3-dehydroquinate dehydratase II
MPSSKRLPMPARPKSKVAAKSSGKSRAFLVLNGPNLNLLGVREPEIYGRATLGDIEQLCAKTAAELGVRAVCRQSNYEGALIDWVQAAHKEFSGIIINPAALSHTSVALMDALRACGLPVHEVHISNIHRRESFRHHSYVSLVAQGVICGCGIFGYALALRAAVAQTGQI